MEEKIRRLIAGLDEQCIPNDAQISELKYVLYNTLFTLDDLRRRWHIITQSKVAGTTREMLEFNKVRREDKKAIIKLLADWIKDSDE